MKTIDPVEDAMYKAFLEVLPREKRRRITILMKNNNPETVADMAKSEARAKEIYGDDFVASEYNKTAKEIYSATGNSFTPDYIYKVWFNLRKERRDNKVNYNAKPLKEGRDNKGVKVGSSGSNGHKIRWPRKNASRATWKNFYKLFPSCTGYKTELEMQNALREKRKLQEATGTLPWYLGGPEK